MNYVLTVVMVIVLGIIFAKVFISKKQKKSIDEKMREKYPPSKCNLWERLAIEQHIDKHLEE